MVSSACRSYCLQFCRADVGTYLAVVNDELLTIDTTAAYNHSSMGIQVSVTSCMG